MSSVAIIIPVYKEKLSAYEEISLQQCYRILGNYKIQFVCPNKMKEGNFHQENKNNATFTFIEDKNFDSITSYNHMLLSVWFYEFFKNFTHILIYQLDCFVFQDDLMKWVAKDYSYIGAPWFLGSSNSSEINELVGVGNGGFSLRNVKDCITVLKRNKKLYSLKECIARNKNSKKSLYLLRGIKQYFKLDTFKTLYTNKLVNEDRMFSLAAKRFEFFKIPNVQIATQFAFEMQPKKLYENNNNDLPFGCHAWWKYNLGFYKPFIETFGYQLNEQI